MNVQRRPTDVSCFQALLGGHDELLNRMSDVAALADALLLNASNKDELVRAYDRIVNVASDVRTHLEDEERGIFPALQASGVPHELILRLERDHSTLRSMMHEMDQLDPTSLRAPRKLAHLVHSFIEFFEWHTEREEEFVLVARHESHAPRSSGFRQETWAVR